MNKFDLSTYDAFREAGYTSEQAVDEIHTHYARQVENAEYQADRKGYDRGVEKNALILKGMVGTLVAVTLMTILWLPIYFDLKSDAKTKARISACASGDTVGCYEAVNYELRGAIRARQNGRADDEREYRDNAAQLLLAYRQKTGTVLPTK